MLKRISTSAIAFTVGFILVIQGVGKSTYYDNIEECLAAAKNTKVWATGGKFIFKASCKPYGVIINEDDGKVES